MTIRDEATRILADRVMITVKSAPNSFWDEDTVMALVREIERLRRGPTPTPALTFWLGADACAP